MKTKLLTIGLVATLPFVTWQHHARADGSGGSEAGSAGGDASSAGGEAGGEAGGSDGGEAGCWATGPEGGGFVDDGGGGGSAGEAGSSGTSEAGGGGDGGTGPSSTGGGGCSVSTANDTSTFGSLAFLAATVGAIGTGVARRRNNYR